MGNCFEDYAEKAVKNECYLFNIMKYGEEASVELSSSRRVLHALGPHNTSNSAAEWGKKVITNWGKKFPENYREPIFGCADPDEISF